MQKDQQKLVFDEETIRALLGHEAAEDEDIEKLRKYYVKTEIYEKLNSSIPLYVLVGHKGVGKSALLKVLEQEDSERGNISITIQPDDVIDIKQEKTEFLQRIRDWKEGLAKIIFKELAIKIQTYSSNDENNKWVEKLKSLILNLIGQTFDYLNERYLHLSSEQLNSFFKNDLFKERTVTIYLDDLDRGWKNSDGDIENLSAMLNAVRDLNRETSNLRFRVALRSDVYYAVRTSDETTDKIDGSVLWLKWSNHEILVMLIKRIEAFYGSNPDEKVLLSLEQKTLASYLDKIFEDRFRGRGHWCNAPMYRVLMSLIRKRPRDLVKLCTLAARKAYDNNHNLIMTNDLESIFSNYSNDRLTDTGNEYQSELPKIKELLLKMKPTTKEIRSGKPCKFSRGELLQKLNNIISMSCIRFKNGRNATASDLAAFLYKINFITARKDSSGGIIRKYYDENQYIYNDFADFGYDYEIHPAYRWALQPESIMSLMEQIDLSE